MVLIYPPGDDWKLDETPLWQIGSEINQQRKLFQSMTFGMYGAWAHNNRGSTVEQAVTPAIETVGPIVVETFDAAEKAADEFNDFVESPENLFADLLTEVLALVGGTFATLVNQVDVDIDDLARPPISLEDTDKIILPYYKGNFVTILPLPDIDHALPLSVTEEKEYKSTGGILSGILRATTLIFPESTTGTRSILFRWKGGMDTGDWA
jgi:hypothetical protein